MAQSSTPHRSGRLYKIRFSFARIAGILILIAVGIIALALSIVTNSTILAMIGLGLVFWGVILSYIQTGEYVKSKIFDATALSMLASLNQIIQESRCKGKAVYLQPKYFNELDTVTIYIPKRRIAKLPLPEQTRKREWQPLTRDIQGIIVTPPSLELTKLFETTLKKSFTKTSLNYLQQKMPKLLIEDLEIATDFEMVIKTSTTQKSNKPDRIRVKAVTSTYKNINRKTAQLKTFNLNIGSPLTSAIACAIAEATNRPITIEKETISPDGKTIEAEYHLLEQEPT